MRRIGDINTRYKAMEEKGHIDLGSLHLCLVRDLPSRQPAQVSPLLVGAFHSEYNGSEVNEQSNDSNIEQGIDHSGESWVHLSCHPVDAEAKVQNGIVKGWVVVVNVSHTSHDDEGKVV